MRKYQFDLFILKNYLLYVKLSVPCHVTTTKTIILHNSCSVDESELIFEYPICVIIFKKSIPLRFITGGHFWLTKIVHLLIIICCNQLAFQFPSLYYIPSLLIFNI